MNERIKQLAEQAGLKWKAQPPHYTNTNNPIDFPVSANRDLEKFAELIVAECLEQVRGEFLPVLEDKEMMKDTHWDGYVQCGVDSVVAIREHFFGVEE
jgi:hypothetical protein